MFRFFHRHQKIVMTTVAAMSAFSFCFYGLYSTFLGQTAPVDPISNELSDGTPVRQSRRDAVHRMLVLEAPMDIGMDRGSFPNVINPGFIRQQILKAGLGALVLERNRDAIQKEWQEILNHQHAYRTYRHPVRPQIGLKQAWGYASPGLLALVETMPEKLDPSFLDHQLALLEASENCPAALTHQILLGMERQARLPHDQTLDRAELRLFGHKSLEDWFGPTFVEGCVDLILEGAHAATLNGIKIRAHDVRMDWITGLNSLKEQGVEAPQALRWLLASLRLTEGQAIDGWSQVMLFDRWLDSALAQEVHTNAALREEVLAAIQKFHEKARVQVLQTPVALKSLRDLAQFECYLDGVGRQRAQPLDLPSDVLSIEQVRRRAPELVVHKVEVALKRIDREGLLAQMPVREMMQWQLSDEGWTTLQNRLRDLSDKTFLSVEDRRSALQKLDTAARKQADLLSQEAWLKNHPEIIASAWEDTPTETLIWELSAAALPSPLPGLPPSSTILGWQDRVDPIDVANEGRMLYRVFSVKSAAEPRIMDYAGAVSSGSIQAYLQRRLHEDWDLLKTAQDPLVAEKRHLSEVEEKLLARRTTKVVKALQDYVAQTLGKTLEGADTLAPYRLASQLTSKPSSSLMADQFSAIQREEFVERGLHPQHLAFELAEGEWSLPHLEHATVQRVQVLERSSSAPTLDLHDAAAQPVIAPAKELLVRRLLKLNAEEL